MTETANPTREPFTGADYLVAVGVTAAKADVASTDLAEQGHQITTVRITPGDWMIHDHFRIEARRITLLATYFADVPAGLAPTAADLELAADYRLDLIPTHMLERVDFGGKLYFELGTYMYQPITPEIIAAALVRQSLFNDLVQSSTAGVIMPFELWFLPENVIMCQALIDEARRQDKPAPIFYVVLPSGQLERKEFHSLHMAR